MKKIKQLCILFIATLCFVLCFAFAGCGETTVNQLLSDYGITAEGGGFEKGSSLVTDLIETTGEEGQEIIALLDEQTYAKDGEVSIYDIFVAKDGIEVQPNGKVKITLPAPFESENGYVTFHVKDDDSVETLVTTYAEGKISFETDSFSCFVIAEDEKYYGLSLINVDGQGTVCFEDLELSKKGDALSTGRHAGKELPLAVKDIEEGYAFIGWFGSTDLSNVWDIKYDNLISAETTFNFTMPAYDYVIYAVFRPIREYNTLGVINVKGLGTVGVDGVEASDESDLSVSRVEGSKSVLVAKDTLDGYAFFGWYGTMDVSNVWALKYEVLLSTEKTFTFTMPAYDYVIYAVFKPVHTVYAFADKDTEGTIKWGEDNQSTSPEVKVAEGKSVTLTAVPNEGCKFLGWYDEPKIEYAQIGNLLCEDAEYTINVVDMDVNIYARFETIPVPVPEKYPLSVGQKGAGGTVSINGGQPSSLESVVYYEEFEAETAITLVAAPRSNDYAFIGWFEPDGDVSTHLVLKETPVSTELTYSFNMTEKGYAVYAVFEAKVTGLILDAANAGFTEGSATYVIGDEFKPVPERVIVSGATVIGNIPFVLNEDYTIDLGGLSFTQAGTYTITYTYKKDTAIKETLTIEVVLPKYAFSALVTGGTGTISYNNEVQPNGYYGELTLGTKISLTATAGEGYLFKGWYEPDGEVSTQLVLKETPVSTNATHEFTAPGAEYVVYAVFEAKVTGLILDGANAGFTEGKATYTIGEANKPTPENVIVSGATVLGSVPFTKDVDYTIDLGGLDFERAGTYTITYTYVKDTNIKETLTIEVIAPKFTFSAVTENANGSIYYNNEVQPNGYQAELEANTSVTLKTVAKNDYEFVGWYTATDVPEFISESAEYTFVTGNADKYVMARFAAKILYLWSDSSNAGFNDNEKSATVTIGDSVLPDPQAVLIYAGTAEGDVLLAKNEDYTIDLGGLDFSQEGTYTITYRHTKNTSLTTTLTVYVVAVQTPVTINLSYSGTADPVKYNGGRAAYVFKSSILNNGEACDIESLGLFYEWRDHTTKAVVAVAKDDTWDSTSAHYPSPAVPGTYDFVVYKMENEVKTDLLTVTRTIVENQFAVVTDLSSLSEYVCYTFIAKAGDNYYAMSNPFTGNSEREAILVTPDSNGVISLGNNYEYVFRPYDTGKTSSSGLVCYGCRTGNGLNRTGNLVLWGTGGIEYTTSTSADYTVTFVLNADGTITVHAPFCEGTLRLVYDATSGKFMFTAKKAVDDTRTSYPVYLYGEYTEPVVEPKETYEFFGKLSKEYDGNAVSFNVYKEVNICTENGEDVAAVLKNETGRFVWTDAKGNVISVGTPDENGNVTGPSAIGSYRLVFQTLQKGENGMEWVEKAVLHSFEITAPAEVN